MNFWAAENITDIARGSFITFDTTTIGVVGRAERMRIWDSGKVTLSDIDRDTSEQLRNMIASTSAPSGGNDGDVWLTYTA